MKITKQKLESLILEEIKSLQEGSPFQEKAKEAQKEFQDSRPWTVSVLASFPKTNRLDNNVPNTLRDFISSSGAAVVHEDYRSEWIKRGHRVYDLDYIKNGGLQGSRGPLILKIIEDAFSFPLQPYVDGEGRETPRENALESDPLVSRPQFAKDPDGRRYITFTTKSGSWVVIDTPPRDTPSQDPQPGITIGPAPAGQGLAENKMKLTKQQLKQIIKEEIESLLEQEQDSVESMIYRFMESGANISDDKYETDKWSDFHDPIDPRTASIERDGKQIAPIINDAFDTKEINRDRNDKPGRLTGRASLQETEDGMPYIPFFVKGNPGVPDMLYRVVNNPNGGIIIEPAPERMNYNEALEQIIKEEIEGLLDEIDLDEKRKKKRKGKMPKKFSVKSGDKSKSGGLTSKGVKRYRRANPGSKLKTAVTKNPKKLKKGGKAAKRRLSFCRRMRGMKKKLTSKKTARDPDSRINKALRKWNC